MDDFCDFDEVVMKKVGANIALLEKSTVHYTMKVGANIGSQRRRN